MSFTNDLLRGLAGVLNSTSVATYRSDDSDYLESETAVTFTLMPQFPARCVTLTAYNATDAVTMARSRIPVQFKFRGSDPLDVNDLADAAFGQLQTLTGVQLGSVWLIQILRNSMVPLGQDDNHRWLRADNYYADINTPVSAHRANNY